MEFNRRGGSAGGNPIEIQYGNSENNVNETGVIGSTDQAVYATKEVVWNTRTSLNTKSKPSHERKLFQFKMGSQRPNKRARNSPLPDLMADDCSKAIGNVFYKTKLCCEFEVGTCPFINNCNYAHGIEELRELPPNLEEIVAAHEEQVESLEQRDVFRIQCLGFVDKAPLPNMRRHGRKFLIEECCQYGENCYSIHNEQYEDRVSEAICLLPGTGSKSNLNASNWKTRMCNKWELTGWCPFGDKCHFAHGSAELRSYNGRPVNAEAGNSSTYANQTALPAKASAGNVDVPTISVPRSYHVRNRSRRLPNVIPKTEEIPTRRWKGPNKISKIYGDWIDDL